MNKFKSEFIKHLQLKTQELNSLIEHLSMQFTMEQAKQMYRLFHTLKGTAPMYDYHYIGKIAQRALLNWEWIDEENPSNGMDRDTQGILAETKQLIGELEQELENIINQVSTEPISKQISIDRPNTKSAVRHSNLLVVDDDGDLRRLMIHRFKRKGFEVSEAHDIVSAIHLLYQDVYDMIILDLNMQPESGYVLFDILKNDPKFKWIPLIVLSGNESVADKVKCLDLGADDYVTKPFHFDELLARINRVITRSKQFEQMAFKDSLTGLYNRRYFDNQLNVELERVQRIPMEMSLAMIDIDRFKVINDTYGHPLGDQVLQGLAYIIKQNLRKSDLLARYGGEEFVVLMLNTDELTSKILLKKILGIVRETSLAKINEQDIFITFSCGVLNWSPDLTADGWLQKADELLYAAKQQGRNRVVSSQGNHMDWVQKRDNSYRKKILIVDDDKLMHKIIESRLEDYPVDIVHAMSGEEAVEILSQQSFDLCMIDIIMPLMNGYELIEHINAANKPKDMKIIMMSSRNKEMEVLKVMQCGADHYLAKPFSLVEFETLIKSFI